MATKVVRLTQTPTNERGKSRASWPSWQRTQTDMQRQRRKNSAKLDCHVATSFTTACTSSSLNLKKTRRNTSGRCGHGTVVLACISARAVVDNCPGARAGGSKGVEQAAYDKSSTSAETKTPFLPSPTRKGGVFFWYSVFLGGAFFLGRFSWFSLAKTLLSLHFGRIFCHFP